MYRHSHLMQQNFTNYKLRSRILAVLLILSLAACAVLGVSFSQEQKQLQRIRTQIQLQVLNSCSEAKSLADKLTNNILSSTPAQLARIRQHVYAMDQLNTLAIKTLGESSRLIPAEALDALYSDIDSYFSIIQSNTVSVLETRTLLVNHLAALQTVLNP